MEERGVGVGRHNVGEARVRRERFREHGVEIRTEPVYRTKEPVIENAEESMDPHKFEPKFKRS
jgi:methylmalonyl-CoA mutase cobalamin-binding subunit